jgi:glycosyltransferase involved in cell wall biosynthesis
VPVYNGERFITETLDSVLKQTFEDWEVIISDNASTDRTPEICQAYARRDSRIRYTRNERNIGSARNFNRTLDLSRGQYFKSANADDLCLPDLVEKCVAVLDDHPEVVLCYGRTTLIDEHGRTLRRYEDGLHLRASSASARFRLAVERAHMINILQGVMRADVLRKTGRLRPYIGSDVVLVAELALHGQLHELPEWLFFRRIHTGAFSSLHSEKLEQEFVDPGTRRPAPPYYGRHFGEYVRAIWRAPLPALEKLQLTIWMLRRAVWARDVLCREILEAARDRLRRR